MLVDNLLIQSEGSDYRFDIQPHLGLLSLLGVARDAGHEGILYDPKLGLNAGTLELDGTLYERIAGELLSLNPEVLGFTSLGCNFICTLKIASYVRAVAPEIPILLGGPHATILDREILERFPQFDVVARHEAEATLPMLLESLNGPALNHIPGITYREGSAIVRTPSGALIDDLDSLPWPAYDAYPIDRLQLRTLRIEAGRGCPFHCTFCSTASFFGRKYRLKSPDRLCAEVEYLMARYGVRDFGLMHDLFTVNRAKVLAFCERARGRGFTWSCSARMDCVDEELIAEMHASGCRSIYYGVETGSVRMQALSEKRQDLRLFDPILDATMRTGMSATVSFILGYPQEEQADLNDTLNLIGSCFELPQDQVKVQLHLLTPEPGTKLLSDFGDTLSYDGYIADFNFPTLESDDATLMIGNPGIFPNHHYFPSIIARRRLVFTSAVFESLYRLGFTLLAHTMSRHGGLPEFLEAIWQWSETKSDAEPSSIKFIESFIEDRWGSDHYLSALLRYAGTALTLTSEVEGMPMKASKPPKIVLNRRAAVLRGIQNCAEILHFLSATPVSEEAEIPGELRTDRASFLIVGDLGTPTSIRNFQITEPVADLLEFVSEPRTEDECVERLGGVSPNALRRLLNRLKTLDAIRAHGPAPRRRAPNRMPPETVQLLAGSSRRRPLAKSKPRVRAAGELVQISRNITDR
ncbi:MAG: radical SAM protein [Acidobacteriota bacterium]